MSEHNEYASPAQPMWLCEVTATPVTPAACLACARQRLQPSCSFNPALLKALAAANQPDLSIEGLRQVGYPVLRVSSLVGCARKAWYARQGGGPPLEKPSEHWARLRGTIFHAALENMGDGHVERRLVAFLYDREMAAFVTGRVDGYDPETGCLTDYKTTRRLPGSLRPFHQRQVWLYAWLLARNGFGIPCSIRVIYLNMAGIHSCDVVAPSPADLDELEANLLSRLRAILAAQPPDAQPEEPWECKYCPFRQCPAHPAQTDTAG